MLRMLIGGSPCTHWSIAQSKNRETEPNGEGWELFKNYLIAKEKFKPDFFLYENNKSAAQAIKNQISKELGEPLQYINSALVSAQNRERFYVHNWECPLPADRGILLKDILESGIVDREKAYCLKHQAGNARDYFKKHHTQISFEPVDYIPAHDSDIIITENSVRCQRRDKKHSTVQGKTVMFPQSKCNTLTSAHMPMTFTAVDEAHKKMQNVYKVCDGKILIKDVLYNINLPDGFYIIRKLTPIECERLQTLPDNYTSGISDTQRYRCLGNGWTAEVIIHILQSALKDVPRDEEIVVLSMYDGIATGRYCLDKMGFRNVRYYAYEIDKYAKQVAMKNYPDILQCGNAFEIRDYNWRLEAV